MERAFLCALSRSHPKKDSCIVRIVFLNENPERRIFHMDDPYIHKKYALIYNILYSPNDEHGFQVRSQHEGSL